MSDLQAVAEDSYLERMKASRSAPSVLKLQLASIRSDLTDVAIFAVEGDDDKIIYFQWINRARPNFTHDYLICRNKLGVLQLADSLSKDLTDLGRNVFFFIDRDFDDMVGFEVRQSIFMTDRYAVENYLVDKSVLDAVLKVEFHCHLRPEIRASICEKYGRLLDRFLRITKDLNRRAFVAKKSGIQFAKPLPDKIGPLAVVELQSVEYSEVCKSDEIVCLKREPSTEEWSKWNSVFDDLAPLERYRGKFTLAFFRRWLDKLHEEYASSRTSTIFRDLDRRANARVAELVLSNFASRSSLPTGFTEFARTWS